MQNEVTATLEHWSIEQIGGEYVWALGHIHNDTRGRFPDGAFVHTSKFKMEDQPRPLQKGSIIKTLNSTYLLGEPLPRVEDDNAK